jgi:ubiquitin-conjugating enzyme E2 D/E
MFNQTQLSARDFVKQQYEDLMINPITNIGLSIGLIDEDDYFKWKCTIFGPKDTPYAGGLFYLRVKFPNDFPNSAPEVCFTTPIYHVNINPKESEADGGQALGHVCISTLNWWQPYYTIREVLNNIYALFYRGNPDSPYGVDRADELKNHKDLYDEKVRYFTKKYASPGRTGEDNYSKKWDFTYDKKE